MHARYFRWVASGRPNDDPSAKSFRDLEESSSGRWSVHGDIPPWGAPFAVELPDGSRLEFGGSEGANGDGGGKVGATVVAGDVVALDALASEAGGLDRAKFFVEKLKITLGADWRGRPSISVKDAARVVNEHRRERAEWQAAQHEYSAYLRQYDRNVHAAGETAFQHTLQAERRREHTELHTSVPGRFVTGALPPGPRAYGNANIAAERARQDYMQRHRKMGWDEWVTKNGAK